MAQTTEKKEGNKANQLGTLDVQNLIFEQYLETYRLRDGKTFKELLKMANDPERYSRVEKSKE